MESDLYLLMNERLKNDLENMPTIFTRMIFTYMIMQEVDEEKVEDPLTGLSGNSSDLSDSEKSSSMQDLILTITITITITLSLPLP